MVEVSEAAIDHVDVMAIVEKSYLWLSRSLVAIEMEKIEQHLIFLLALLFIPQFCCSVL